MAPVSEEGDEPTRKTHTVNLKCNYDESLFLDKVKQFSSNDISQTPVLDDGNEEEQFDIT